MAPFVRARCPAQIGFLAKASAAKNLNLHGDVGARPAGERFGFSFEADRLQGKLPQNIGFYVGATLLAISALGFRHGFRLVLGFGYRGDSGVITYCRFCL